MENGPFEDVLPVCNGIFHCYVSLPEGTSPHIRMSNIDLQLKQIWKFPSSLRHVIEEVRFLAGRCSTNLQMMGNAG